MSDATAIELLTREEIGALMDELRLARAHEHESRRLPLLRDEATTPGPSRTLRRGLERYASLVSRALASRFQRRLELRLLDLEALRAADVADLVLPHDRMIAFEDASGARSFLWVARSLWLAWMRIAFGAAADLRVDPLPDRPPTPIELRFLRRTGEELVAMLGTALGARFSITSLEDASALRDQRALRLTVAAFELHGLEEIGRIRVALPREPARDGASPPLADHGGALEHAVLDAEVAVTVLAGATQLPLARLAQLAIGDGFSIEAPRGGLVTVAVDGAPKFRARRGQLGSRLAVQIVERLEQAED